MKQLRALAVLVLSLAVGGPAYAQNVVESIGWLPANPSIGTGTQIMNAAGAWPAFAIGPAKTKTINEFRAYLHAAPTGTLAESEVTLDIYSTTGINPNASVAGPYGESDSSGNITTLRWLSWAPSYAMTSGVQYWAVIKNTNATQASNYPTIRYTATDSVPKNGGSTSASYGNGHKTGTTDSGTNWATGEVIRMGGYRIGYTDGSYEGWPIENLTASAQNDSVFNSSKYGVEFTTPAVKIKTLGATMYVAKTGTPTPTANGFYYELYSGSTLLATSYKIEEPAVPTTGNGYQAITLYWDDGAHEINASTSLRLVMVGATNATNANCYRTYEYQWDSDSNSQALKPYGASRILYQSGAWGSATTTIVIPFQLELDPTTPFPATTSGSVGIIGG